MRASLRAAHLAAAAAASAVATLLPAAPAEAHPLGNFSVNQYAGITVTPRQVRVASVLNTAEIPTRRERAAVDVDRDGRVTAAERAAYADRTCRDLAGRFHVDVDGRRLDWRTTPGELTYAAGAAGLSTARLTCALAADVQLDVPAAVTVANLYRVEELGWNELTAVGTGLRLVSSPLPQRSPSDELRVFPASESPSALSQVRTAKLRVAPGESAPVAVAAPTTPDTPALAAATGWAERRFATVASGPLSPVVVILAVLLALLLGAGHAVLPGHGKTVFAAYLAGRDGRPRDAFAIGATVTLAHTGSVIVVGLLITTGTAFAAREVLGGLGIASGLLIAAVGCGMAIGVLRRRRAVISAPPPDAAHTHHHAASHAHHRATRQEVGHEPGHGHTHGHGHGHTHGRSGVGGPGRWSLAGIGVAGGLVPSPSALVVLLAAVGLGQALFGVLLVVAYGVGMAATLTAAGLLLLVVRRRFTGAVEGRLARLGATLSAAVPGLTAAMVIVVGAGLAVRAAAGLW